MKKYSPAVTCLVFTMVISACSRFSQAAVSTQTPLSSSTFTPQSTATPTPISPTPTPTLGIGSSFISLKDGMRMMYVPEGIFNMGSPDGVGDELEHPQHMVRLHAYWIDETEVTNAMFSAFIDETKYTTDAEIRGYSWDPFASSHLPGVNWRTPQGEGTNLTGLENHPVVQVSWWDARAYCEWAGRRLPTEAEWEKAARGNTLSEYPWGNKLPAGNFVNFADWNLIAEWADKSANDGYKYTSPVGSYPEGKSPYEALDMAGNVAEWVADRTKKYPSGIVEYPQAITDSPFAVYRGGGWNSDLKLLRSAYRDGNVDYLTNGNLGFRCATSFQNTTLPQPSIPVAGIGTTRISPIDGMTLMYVPAGTFLMGTALEGLGNADEFPQHSVYLSAFWIDQTEVTNKMYNRCIAEGYCTKPVMWPRPEAAENVYKYSEYADFPVVDVLWEQASDYCNWAGRSLPTEAQWEKAARGPIGQIYPWGIISPNKDLVNLRANEFWTFGETKKVGSYPAGASPYSALDITGNASEWVADWYDANYYQSSPQVNPAGPADGEYHVVRGGSANGTPNNFRAATRSNAYFELSAWYVGFRCALDESILYADHFSKLDDPAWQQGGDTIPDNSGTLVPNFRNADGQYLITFTRGTKGTSIDASTLADGLNFSSGVLSADFQFEKQSSPGSTAEFFFWASPDRSHQLQLNISMEGRVWLLDLVAGQNYFEGSAKIQAENINHVDVAFGEDSVTIIVNHVNIGSVNVFGFSDGGIGLGAAPMGGGSSTIAFDNVIVRSYDYWSPPVQ